MTKNKARRRAALRIQAETGMPYTAALRAAAAENAVNQALRPGPDGTLPWDTLPFGEVAAYEGPPIDYRPSARMRRVRDAGRRKVAADLVADGVGSLSFAEAWFIGGTWIPADTGVEALRQAWGLLHDEHGDPWPGRRYEIVAAADSSPEPLTRVVRIISFKSDTVGFDGQRHTSLRLTVADRTDIAVIDLSHVLFIHPVEDDEPVDLMRPT